MHEVPVWLQVLFGFGGFTVVNVISMAVMWGRMQETIKSLQETDKKHSNRLNEVEDRLDPKDSELRFITCKECTLKQNTLTLVLIDIKGMLAEMDKRHEARINRIDTRWEGNLKLIYSLSGRVGVIESGDTESDKP